MEGAEAGQGEAFVVDMGVGWEPAEGCHMNSAARFVGDVWIAMWGHERGNGRAESRRLQGSSVERDFAEDTERKGHILVMVEFRTLYDPPRSSLADKEPKIETCSGLC